MPDIRIHRDHELGLEQARKVAWQWAEEVEKKFDMECAVLEGETSDTVSFSRTGVKGRLIVAADHFDLEAKLGFLLGAFAGTIESSIQKELDTLLARAPRPAAPARKTATKPPAKAAARTPNARGGKR
jgi:putative polyhydroxyalkanoate system protein